MVLHENQFLLFLRVAVLHRFYCTYMNHKIQQTDLCILDSKTLMWRPVSWLWPALSDNWSWKPFFFRVAALHRFYRTYMNHMIQQTGLCILDSNTLMWRRVSWLFHSRTAIVVTGFPLDLCTHPRDLHNTWNLGIEKWASTWEFGTSK